jgi:hypothetical protein
MASRKRRPARPSGTANSLEAGFAMIRKLGQERREDAADRKQAAAAHIKELEGEPFVKQMRGLLWGLDTGLLTVGEMQLALSKFVTAEEAK